MAPSDILAIMLSTYGSKGGHLLFRYPYDDVSMSNSAKGNSDEPDAPFLYKPAEEMLFITNQYSDEILKGFLAVQPPMADKQFDVKVDEVQFVGFPVTLNHSQERQKPSATTIVNVTIALPDTVSEETKACYHQLSKQIAMALKHEERRCCYFCSQKKKMMKILDPGMKPAADTSPPSQIMLREGISLAKTLKNVFDKISAKGVVIELVNNWTEINFCLPIKTHNLPFENELRIKEADVNRCLDLLRPYHAMLLLVDHTALINSLPIDSSPALIRLLRVSTAIKNLQDLAADSDLELTQVLIRKRIFASANFYLSSLVNFTMVIKLVGHLVYWAKATVIYPMCEPNVYVLSPNAPLSMQSELSIEFKSQFGSSSNLAEVMAEFSLPLPLGEHHHITDTKDQRSKKVQMVMWMLKRRLLIQLHTYIFLRPSYKAEGLASLDVDGADAGCTRFNSDIYLNDAGREKMQTLADSESEPIFTKLLPSLDGTHHLEELMYYKNLSKTDLLTVIDKYQPMLYTLQAADPATSYYVKY